jgi:hypothetical protein
VLVDGGATCSWNPSSVRLRMVCSIRSEAPWSFGTSWELKAGNQIEIIQRVVALLSHRFLLDYRRKIVSHQHQSFGRP